MAIAFGLDSVWARYNSVLWAYLPKLDRLGLGLGSVWLAASKADPITFCLDSVWVPIGLGLGLGWPCGWFQEKYFYSSASSKSSASS